MQGPASDVRHDHGVPIDKMPCVIIEPIMLVKTNEPEAHLDPLSGDGALDDEGLDLETGET